jgi:hypothetical protein
MATFPERRLDMLLLRPHQDGTVGLHVVHIANTLPALLPNWENNYKIIWFSHIREKGS